MFYLYGLILLVIISILGLLSHLVGKRPRLEWVLRLAITAISIWDLSLLLQSVKRSDASDVIVILALTAFLSFSVLFCQIRAGISYLLTIVQMILTGQILLPIIRRKLKAADYIKQKRKFSPQSIPHFFALALYIDAVGLLLANARTKSDFAASILIDPSFIQQMLPCCGLAFMAVSFCGIGLFISRSPAQALQRLSLTPLKRWQIFLAGCLVLATFAFEAYWILYTHNAHNYNDLAVRLSYYNSATFTILDNYAASVLLAVLFSALSAIGEEIFFRGALQPVFGIVPTALLQSVLLSQMHFTPLSFAQILIWSSCMGMIKRCTNTSTTIVIHLLFNMITLLLYVANP